VVSVAGDVGTCVGEVLPLEASEAEQQREPLRDELMLAVLELGGRCVGCAERVLIACHAEAAERLGGLT
jgi:hypothetical protein